MQNHSQKDLFNFYHIWKLKKIFEPIEDFINNYSDNLKLNFWYTVSLNPRAIYLIDKYNIKNHKFKIKINFKYLSSNIIVKNKDFDYWLNLSNNTVEYNNIENNLDNINWRAFSGNKDIRAISILEQNQDKINWAILIHLLEQNQDKIDWENLSQNSLAIYLLEQNQDKIHWHQLSKNPSIFELDYDFFHQRMNIIRQELFMKAWHPDRFYDWCLAIQDKYES